MALFKGEKKSKQFSDLQNFRTWEEESGFLDFLAAVPEEAKRFDDVFEFGIGNTVIQPSDIDGDKEMPLKVGFVLKRDNPLMSQLTYCLYSRLNDKLLYGYIGIYKDGSITTLKELEPVRDFKKGKIVLYDWMRQLVRASVEKMTV